MFKTFQGVTENAKNEIFLRPETAQGIFVNFQNIQRTTRKKAALWCRTGGQVLPQRNHSGNFTSRTREFEQMELEFFCKPGTDLEWFKYWKDYCHNWLLSLGMKDGNLRLRDHDPEADRPTIPMRQPISNFCSRLAGRSCGALRTAPILT